MFYFHAMTDDWISPQMQLAISLLTRFWGPDAMKITTIVTTKWELVPEANAQKRLETLEKGLWKPLLDGGCNIKHLSSEDKSSALLYSALERIHEPPVKMRGYQGLGDDGGNGTKTRHSRSRRLTGKSNEHSTALSLSALRALFWLRVDD